MFVWSESSLEMVALLLQKNRRGAGHMTPMLPHLIFGNLFRIKFQTVGMISKKKCIRWRVGIEILDICVVELYFLFSYAFLWHGCYKYCRQPTGPWFWLPHWPVTVHAPEGCLDRLISRLGNDVLGLWKINQSTEILAQSMATGLCGSQNQGPVGSLQYF